MERRLVEVRLTKIIELESDAKQLVTKMLCTGCD